MKTRTTSTPSDASLELIGAYEELRNEVVFELSERFIWIEMSDDCSTNIVVLFVVAILLITIISNKY